MAEDRKAAGPSFMPVPPMYTLYSEDAVKDGTCPKPPPPPKGEYTVYGVRYNRQDEDKLPWKVLLEMENWLKLIPNGDFDMKSELKKITMSLLFNYTELIQALAENPTNWHGHFTALVVLLQNFQALLNQYRPHQARETLKSMLDLQEMRRLEMADEVDRTCEAVRELLVQCVSEVFPEAEAAWQEYENELKAVDNKNEAEHGSEEAMQIAP